MERPISRLSDDVSVSDALAVVQDGWVGLTGMDEKTPPALISVGALRDSPDPSVSLRSIVVKRSATYVESAQPESFSSMELVLDDDAWRKPIIVLGTPADMPDTCPKCGSMSHGLPCQLLP